VAAKVQLTHVRVIVAVLKSRVSDPLFPPDTVAEFFNTIDPERTFAVESQSVLIGTDTFDC
jgi:hypothetical protein